MSIANMAQRTFASKFEEFTFNAVNHIPFQTDCSNEQNTMAFYQVASMLKPTKTYCPMLWIIDSSGLKTYHHIREINKFSNYHQWINFISTRQNNNIHSDQQEIEPEQIVQRVNEDRYATMTHVHPRELGVVFFSINHGSLSKVRPWSPHTGQFWIYTHNTLLNLTPLQIFRNVESKNYYDSCFIHTIKESGLFTLATIDSLRFFIKTRNFPKSKIRHICEFLNCNIEVITIDENGKKYVWRSKTLRQFKDMNYDKNLSIYLWKNHYFINKQFTIRGKEYDPVQIIKSLFRRKLFQPIDPMCNELLKSLEYKNKIPDYQTLDYDEKACRLFKCNSKTKEYDVIIYSDFETDTSTEFHIPYLICSCFIVNGKNQFIKFEGEDCAEKYLNWLPNKSLIFFHNLKYDGSFFLNTKTNKQTCQIMERNGHIMQIYMKVKNKTMTFRDSYVMISQPLRNFQQMFHLPVHKEVSPYKIYNRENRNKRKVNIIEILNCLKNENPLNYIEKQYLFNDNCLQLKLINDKEHDIIYHYIRSNDPSINPNIQQSISIHPINPIDTSQRSIPINPIHPIDTMDTSHRYDTINPIHPIRSMHTSQRSIPINPIDTIHESIHPINPIDTIHVDIMAYAIHYCAMDCKVLMSGIIQFNKDLQSIFTDNECQFNHITDFISISSLAYNLTAQYGCFDECYELTGKPQNFIMRCMNGGRTMLRNNQKQHIIDKIQDFDAVSLYPSAMRTMIGIPKGKPKIITNEVSMEQIDHLKNQPGLDVSGSFHSQLFDYYFIEIEVLEIDNIYSFPLLQHEEKINGQKKKIYSNSTGIYYVDKRTLLDLIEFYPNFKYKFIRGYYYDDGFNTKINTFIQKLFDLRVKYKKEKNPLETTIKLLLNSIYGKSMLRETTEDINVVNKDDLERYVVQHQHSITQINENTESGMNYIKTLKPINNHYNLCIFGVCVLSQSKHLMNRVMCLAENNGIEIFYVDTDSMHIRDKDINFLAKLFKDKYGEELIGSNLCQFHSDFTPVNGKTSWSIELIALGKKSYIDILVNEDGDIDYHIRMKGIGLQVIQTHCLNHKITPKDIFLKLYEGESIEFNMLEGGTSFKKTKTYQQKNPDKFNRTVKF
ncbi:MAG: DNA polymerase [Methanobrevibacter sp.]|jgi:hypothetical protein|nr:DNA polymerase [Candidatus Methanovirga australis]